LGGIVRLEEFAAKYNLKAKKSPDDWGEEVIFGKRGQIYEWGTNPETAVFELGVMFMPPPTKEDRWGRWCPRTWGNFRRRGQSLGMAVLQNGDSEGCLSFDPANKEQAELAIKIAKVPRRRRLSPEVKAKLLAVGQEHRFLRRDTGQTGA
jgi:hypothetical protein